VVGPPSPEGSSVARSFDAERVDRDRRTRRLRPIPGRTQIRKLRNARLERGHKTLKKSGHFYEEPRIGRESPVRYHVRDGRQK